MKTLTALCFALIVVGAANAQTDTWLPTFGVDFNYMSPTGGMKQNIRNGFGGTASILLEAPSKRIAAGLEFNITGYGHTRTTTDYSFPDGTTAAMEMTVNNNFTSVMGVTRLYFILDGPVRPYATVKAGYTFFNTTLSIFDPDDGDSCEPLESDILSKDGTFAYSAGGGVRMDLAWLFKNVKKGNFYIDLSSSILQGGRVEYMNENPPNNSNSNMHAGRVKEVTADFINTQTQVVHPHHVGYLYNSFLQMVDFRLGMSMRMFR
ncbi:MAG TPA: outer membrane beta-barrel protein [Cyclobacteriaceae bacterium]|nr:outer membrane beta-barrel protein [Cyclobacteriaceae bacterium]